MSRLYLYQFYVPSHGSNWDTALIDANGVVRDMYTTFKNRPNA